MKKPISLWWIELKIYLFPGGENVYPAEIERGLIAHNAIGEAAVIGVTDQKWGEVGKALIVAHEDLSQDEVLQHCKKALAKYKVPKHIQFVDQLPKTDTGKIDRARIKELYA